VQIDPGRTDETQGRHDESPWNWSAYTGLNRDNKAVVEEEMEKREKGRNHEKCHLLDLHQEESFQQVGHYEQCHHYRATKFFKK